MQELPIPVIIYRLRPEEAYEMGILADTIGNIGQLQSYSFGASSHTGPSLPVLAALSTDEGMAHSQETKSLWLLHPQLQELQVYRDNPPLLALKQSMGFYEAYLPHDSSAVPHEWHSELGPQEDSAAPGSWLKDQQKQAFLGILGNHFSHWQQESTEHRIFSGAVHAELQDLAVDLRLDQEFKEQEFRELASLPFKGKRGEPNPREAWLNEADSALKELCSAGDKATKSTSKEQQSLHLAQALWALTAFWISAKLSPSSVLRKLTTWLEREKKRTELQKKAQIARPQ